MAPVAESLLHGSASVLDGVRASALRAFGRSGQSLLRNRGARVAAYGAFGVGLAFTLTAVAPIALLAIGPLVLGVPHLLSDVRYLVARPGLHRRPGFWTWIAAPLLATLVYPGAATAMAAVAGAAVLARGNVFRRGLVHALAALLAIASIASGHAADVVLAHAHNLVAIGLWVTWRRERLGPRWIPLIAFGALSCWLLCGALDAGPWSGADGYGLTRAELLRTLAPPAWKAAGDRFVLFFAFAQSVHYVIWLRLLPEDARPRPGIRSFAASARALASDVGRMLPLAAIAVTGLLLVGAGVAPRIARGMYLDLACFHGPLELACIALAFIERSSVPVADGR
jgi:hypothetical protein